MDGERVLCKKNVTTISQFSLQFSSRRCRRQPYFNTHACQCEKFIHKTEAFHGFVYRKKSFSFLSKINFDFIDFSSVFINISLQLCLWMFASVQLNADGKSLSSLAHDVKEKCQISSNWKY